MPRDSSGSSNVSSRSVRIEGLMTVGPLVDDPQQIRPCFPETKALFD
ncbi:hypothetical protein KJ567_02540 [Candidatus Bipolaricaulota bacterium]|nr:hypothetical protein [Candidatus Bipolaricaulota bacterium]